MFAEVFKRVNNPRRPKALTVLLYLPLGRSETANFSYLCYTKWDPGGKERKGNGCWRWTVHDQVTDTLQIHYKIPNISHGIACIANGQSFPSVESLTLQWPAGSVTTNILSLIHDHSPLPSWFIVNGGPGFWWNSMVAQTCELVEWKKGSIQSVKGEHKFNQVTRSNKCVVRHENVPLAYVTLLPLHHVFK